MDVVNDPAVLGYIKFLTGPLAGTTCKITKPITSIGREPGNDIVVSDPSVSRHHAQILWSNGNWSIRKVAPQNVIRINQVEVHQSPLQNNDTVGLGAGTTFLFQSSQAPQATPPPPPRAAGPAVSTPPLPRAAGPVASTPPPPYAQQVPFPQSNATPPGFQAPVSPPMQKIGPTGTEQVPSKDGPGGTIMADVSPGSPSDSISTPTLEITTNVDQEKHSYQLVNPVIDIGRDPSNTIVINRPTVSSFHVQIVREGNQLVLVHPNPKRGNTLNGIDFRGTSVPGDQTFRRVLTRGDVFRISDENGTFVTLTYNDGSGAVQEAVPEIRP
ncbi:MAG TPA: FHA domain-containing protein, partial [Ktedonobacteraceae bacterium]